MSTPYNWEPEPEPDDLGPETLWDEYWANMDASRDEEVPDPEDDAPVPYWPALQPLTTEQLTARLARLAEQRQSTSATAPVCSRFVPASRVRIKASTHRAEQTPREQRRGCASLVRRCAV